MTRIFTLLLPLAGLLAFAGVFVGGCTPSPYYTDPDYTEYNRPRTVIVREPSQPPRAVIVRDDDHRPPGRRPPPDDHRPPHKPPPEHRKPSDAHREHQGDVRPPREERRQRSSDARPSRRRPQDTEN